MSHDIPLLSTLSSLAIDPLTALTNEDLLKEHDDIFHVYVKTIAGNATESVLGSIFGEKTLCKMLPILEDGEMTIKNGDDDSKRIYEKMVDTAKKIQEIIDPTQELLPLNSLNFTNIMNYINDSKNDLSNLLLSACDNGYSGIVNAIIISDNFLGSEKVDDPIVTPDERLDFEMKLFNQAFTKACEKGHVEIVEMMLSSNRFQIEENTANDNHQINWSMGLSNAAKHGHLDVFKTIIESNHGINIPIFRDNNKGCLSKALQKAGKYGHLDIVKFIMGINQFNDIPANEFSSGLGRTLIDAAEHGHYDIVNELINNERFHEISGDGDFVGIGNLLAQAAIDCKIELISKIEESREFHEIPVFGEYSLHQALDIAAYQDVANTVRHFFSNDRYNAVFLLDNGPNVVDDLFVQAAEHGSIEVIRAIMEDDKFYDIQQNEINYAFVQAAKKGHLEIVRAIMENARFNEIPTAGEWGIDVAFGKAANNGHVEIVRSIMENERFNEIPATGEQGLNTAFISATENGHVEVVRDIMKNERFDMIPAIGHWGLDFAFVRAVESGHVEIVKAIMEHDKFNMIPTTGEWGLDLAFVRAVESGHVEIVKAIIENERFESILYTLKIILIPTFTNAIENGHVEMVKAIMESDIYSNPEPILKIMFMRSLGQSYINGHPEIARIRNVIEFVESNLLIALSEASKYGYDQILQMVLFSRNLKTIPTEILTESLLTCAQHDHMSTFSKIIGSTWFEDILANGNNGLGHLLYALIKNGKESFAKKLLFCNRLTEINGDGPYGMGSIMEAASLDLFKKIIDELQQEKALKKREKTKRKTL